MKLRISTGKKIPAPEGVISQHNKKPVPAFYNPSREKMF
jgi:hypothetical protein